MTADRPDLHRWPRWKGPQQGNYSRLPGHHTKAQTIFVRWEVLHITGVRQGANQERSVARRRRQCRAGGDLTTKYRHHPCWRRAAPTSPGWAVPTGNSAASSRTGGRTPSGQQRLGASGGSTVAEVFNSDVANLTTISLAPVSLLVTALGASLKWLAELFGQPTEQQEVPLKEKGIFLIEPSRRRRSARTARARKSSGRRPSPGTSSRSPT